MGESRSHGNNLQTRSNYSALSSIEDSYVLNCIYIYLYIDKQTAKKTCTLLAFFPLPQPSPATPLHMACINVDNSATVSAQKKKNVHSARITTQTAAIAVISRRRWNNFTGYSESYKDSEAKKHLVFQAKPRISYFKQTSAASMRWWLGSSVSRWCITSTYLSSFLFKAATVSTCGAVLPKYLKRSEFDNSENLTSELLDFIEHSKLCTYLHIICMHRTFYAAGQTLGKKIQ